MRTLGRRSWRWFAASAGLLLAASLTACGSGGAVAPVSTEGGAATGSAAIASTGFPEVDAVQAAIGGNWGAPQELPHSACPLPGEEAPGTGMQSITTTVSQADRSSGDARAAAELAAEALVNAGATPGEVTDVPEGGASVSATTESAATIVVTVVTDSALIEYRTECISTGGEAA